MWRRHSKFRNWATPAETLPRCSSLFRCRNTSGHGNFKRPHYAALGVSRYAFRHQRQRLNHGLERADDEIKGLQGDDTLSGLGASVRPAEPAETHPTSTTTTSCLRAMTLSC